MAVYMIVEIAVQDRDQYARYVEQVAGIVERHGGRYLVRGGAVTPVSGNWNPQRVIVIEFDTIDAWRTCFTSPEYLAVAPFRENSTVAKAIVVEGCSSRSLA